jgi:hypothetical protein
MSHGHLSKVERGEHGRPVTPAIVNAYQRVLGINVTEAITGNEPPAKAKDWRPGVMTHYQRATYSTQVGALAIGGHAGKTPTQLLQAAGAVAIPKNIDTAGLDSLDRIASLLHELSGLAGNVAHALMLWVLRLPADDPHMGPRVHAIQAQLARRAARGAVDLNRHDSARTLHLLALDAAVRSGVPDLRAWALADIAAHHLTFDYYDDSLNVLRLAEGDERTGAEVRIALRRIRHRQQP